MKALIIVDMQNDFCPGGNLAVNEGDKIIQTINELSASGNYHLVVATLDSHPANHKSFAVNNPGTKVKDLINLNGLPQVMWPAHCVKNSEGEKLHKDLNIEFIHRYFKKGENPEIDSYSGFFDNGKMSATGLGEFLLRQGITEVHVVGLAFDYCVKFTAIDSQALGFKTTVILAATKPVDASKEAMQSSLEELQEAGVTVA